MLSDFVENVSRHDYVCNQTKNLSVVVGLCRGEIEYGRSGAVDVVCMDIQGISSMLLCVKLFLLSGAARQPGYVFVSKCGLCAVFANRARCRAYCRGWIELDCLFVACLAST